MTSLLERFSGGREQQQQTKAGEDDLWSHVAASALRGNRGSAVAAEAPLAAPERPLTLYNYEGNQFCRLVRETLVELDLPYVNVATGKGSKRRDELRALVQSNSSRCPYLVDPNTGTALGESQAIIAYLRTTYATTKKKKDPPRRRALKAAIADVGLKTRRGAGGFPDDRARAAFDAIVAELVSLNPTPKPALSGLVNADWDLVWTTEKELLFVADKGIFGLPCVAVTQTIDLPSRTLQNLIFCRNDNGDTAYLRVDSSIRVDPDSDSSASSSFANNNNNNKDDRLAFEFEGCRFKWKAFETPLPPVGKGGLELAYLDDDFRVQFDTRGDTLIAAKRSAPFLLPQVTSS